MTSENKILRIQELERELKKLEATQKALEDGPLDKMQTASKTLVSDDTFASDVYTDVQKHLQESQEADKEHRRQIVDNFYDKKSYFTLLPDYDNANPAPEPQGKQYDVTFTESGSLGLELDWIKQTRSIYLIDVSDGSQAQSHPQIRRHSMLTAVNSKNIRGIKFEGVCNMLREAARPLTLTFVAPFTKPIPAPKKITAAQWVERLDKAIEASFLSSGKLGIGWIGTLDNDNTEIAMVNELAPGTQVMAFPRYLWD